MKLMLRPQWRLWPISSFLGVLDLKTGVIVALLFALFNKVAGVYGLIAVLTGAGGSFAQVSLYIYSALGLVALGWGLNAIKEENPVHSLYFAHLFFVDHVLSTAWTAFFAVVWWLYTPHDGRHQSNSAAQDAIRQGAGVNHTMTDAQRAAAADMIWQEEKGTAAMVIVVSWLSKIYFALLLYSYAVHLRKGSYNSIRHFRSSRNTSPSGYNPALAEDEDDHEDFHPRPYRSNGTLSNITDFVSAPGRNGRHSAKQSRTSLGKITIPTRNGEDGEVLFEDEEP
ncbi:Inositolphosphorylceramide synthase subunit Kei1-domain-containing protein [Hygrophoropsis aurantiaca]|uniref:Inositolphosphorylceramide synthase subunit Kei1-domain-containing protein n=1 Tax=Hygrophoropsis aurantiaca TaxID=72124 RepID=A0ACB8ABA2_9AGAM|nr:Inositolphosphorylceramide synthase subunit Kei1-domain-containing protein [Hygrophoropsis aurantiaca]